MNAAQRRMVLYELLQSNGSVEVADLAERFGVSTMTVRRDFALFERQGLISTNYGGATLKQGTGIEPSFALKQGQMTDVKQQIAERAAGYINDGDSIILDCGTTTLEILKYLQNKKITVITNSWPAVGYLHGNSRVKLYLAPGKYDELSAGVISTMTVDFYRKFHADLVFVSTQGFSPDYGATVPDPTDASVKEALLESGEKRILLADSSKIGKKYLSRHARPEQFDVIITDSAVPEALVPELKACCPVVEFV